MSRSAEWRGLGEDSFRTEVARDLDAHDTELEDLRRDQAETKETNKWILRTLIALLVSTLLLTAGVIIR